MARSPDTTELLAERHLKSRFNEVIYEPDGNISPDFLVDHKVAVEVRRLNQNEILDGKTKGLEESSEPLAARFNRLLNSFGSPQSGKSWFVSYSFQRPLPNWKLIEPIIRNTLEQFKTSPRPGLIEIKITDTFSLKIIPSTIALNDLFCLGGYTDFDSGGWILYEVDRNLKICIQQKNPKIDRTRYNEWWLLLIDYVGYSLSESDRQEFKSFFDFEHPWDRIILIDPTNTKNYFEIY